MASRTLEMIIKSLQQGKGVTEITNQLKEGKKGIEDFNKSGKDAAAGTKTSTDSMSSSFLNLKSMILPVMAGATAAIVGFKQVMEWSEEGAALQRLESSSESMARSVGLDMRNVVTELKRASLNTMSETDMMATATKAMMLGVGSSAEQMGALMETAIVRGRAMGLTTAQAFGDIVTGIGRNSRMILDNLGIILDLDQAYEDYAKTLGVSTQALTEQQKKEALTQAVIKDTQALLEETGGIIADNMTKLEQYDAASKNFWDNRKKDIGGWKSNFMGIFYELFDHMNEGEARADAMNEALSHVPLEEWQFMKMAASGLNDEIDMLTNHVLNMVSQFGDDIFFSPGGTTQGVIDYYVALHQAGIETDILNGKTGDLKVAWGYAKSALEDSNLPLEKKAELLEKIALLEGTVTQEQLNNRDAQEDLALAFANGLISQEAYLDILEELVTTGGDVASAIAQITAELGDLPLEKRIKIILEKYGDMDTGFLESATAQAGGTSGGSGGGKNWVRAGVGWEVNTETGEYRAAPWQKGHGGTVEGGQTYLTNELQPEVFVAPKDGLIVPIGGAAQEAMNGGVTINLYGTIIREDADIEKIAVELVRRMR